MRKYFICFIIIICIFNLLLFLSSLFPSNLIEEKVKESSEILYEEGNTYKFFEFSKLYNNNYTDAIMINEAFSIDNENPIYSYMSARKNYNRNITKETLQEPVGELKSVGDEKYDPVGELKNFVEGNITTSISYARYWHGYLIGLRTLLLFFNISQIRILLLVVFILLFVYLVYLLKKELGIIIAFIIACSLILEGYFFVSYSLESAPIFIVMMVASIFLLNRIKKIKNFYLYIFVVGCISNFVDYLTVPLITLAIPLYIYVLHKQKENTILNYKNYLIIVIKASVIWLIGYGMTWLSKWIMYDIIYNEDVMKSAISQMLYRTSRENRITPITIGMFLRTFITINVKYAIIIFCIIVFVSLVIPKKIKIRIEKWKIYLNKTIPIFIISLMPIIWYIILSNHTVLHVGFVYRHMIIFLIGVVICLKNIFEIKKIK